MKHLLSTPAPARPPLLITLGSTRKFTPQNPAPENGELLRIALLGYSTTH
ncbi:hypothetical protein [Spirosoma radiotolerans]|nr:hypothetical protein [Spirosoma radiotolerans]